MLQLATSVCVLVHTECWLCSNWNTWTKWGYWCCNWQLVPASWCILSADCAATETHGRSEATDVATGNWCLRLGAYWVLTVQQLKHMDEVRQYDWCGNWQGQHTVRSKLVFRDDVPSIRAKWAETIYESGTVKIVMIHQKMKEVVPKVNVCVAIQWTTCTRHSSLLHPQWQRSSAAICYVDGHCHSFRRIFQTWNRARRSYGTVSEIILPGTDGFTFESLWKTMSMFSHSQWHYMNSSHGSERPVRKLVTKFSVMSGRSRILVWCCSSQ